jgi:LPPG:FO 2-phospho-L-lactate transferase
VRAIAYEGATAARPHAGLMALLRDPALRLVVLCPSNPFLSIDPILSLPGLRDALRTCRAPVIAVSPLVGGKAVKGPTAKLMAELGMPVSAASVAAHYRGVVDLFIAEPEDAASLAGSGVAFVPARTLMLTLADRERLARAVLAASEAR